MNGDKVTEEIKEIPLSADIICRRIIEMSQDIKCQPIDRVKRGKYDLQLDESPDVSGLAQLIVFVRYIANGKFVLLMCVALSGTCTGEDIFSAVDTRLHNYGLSWECCISIRTDGQWWILGEANEAVASGPPLKIGHIVSFRSRCFFRDHYEVGTKSGKYKIDSR